MVAISPFLVLVMFVYGTIVASFSSLVAERLPLGQSIVFSRSRCSECTHKLRGRDVIPVVSWILLRGRCRYCHAALSTRYLLFEVIGGCLWAATTLHLTNWPQIIAWSLFWSYLITVVQTDLLYLRVPNKLSLPGALVFLILSVTLGIQRPVYAVTGLAINFSVLWLLSTFTRGKMGAGDAKLYASIGAMLGPGFGLFSLMVASFAGTLVGMTLRGLNLLQRGEAIAFVPYIAFGVIITVFWGSKILGWYWQVMLPQ